ncbi:hypothetical protein HDV04_003605 [Boothiomyces sp. JEL0838]|nr:hypothetical protein HDV04_003605 [Boothiomyces sp. JEL0838]
MNLADVGATRRIFESSLSTTTLVSHDSCQTIPDTENKSESIDKEYTYNDHCDPTESSVTVLGTYEQPRTYPEKELFKYASGLDLLAECVVAITEHRLPENGIVVEKAKKSQFEYRHGISRYSPYGTRFAAILADGKRHTSHIAGELSQRFQIRPGKSHRTELILVPHEGELFQLETAWTYFENLSRKGVRPGPSELLHHLKEMNCDFDYRKGDGSKLLQRNASNFYKRVMEYGKRNSQDFYI